MSMGGLLLKKVMNKLRSGSWFPFYHTLYRYRRIDRRLILLESRRGSGVEGNILALLKELGKPEYAGFRLVLSAAGGRKKQIRKKLEACQIRRCRIVTIGSLSYYACLTGAGYLINDTTFPGRFSKKEGQIYLNVWHGTPLKKMGKDDPEGRIAMGNVLRNLLMADYLVFPGREMEETMTHAYMLDALYKGTILHAGYPRNDRFARSRLAGEKRADTRRYAFMPTFRGDPENPDTEAVRRLSAFLEEMDGLLQGDETLLVRLHPLERAQICLERFCHILPFPEEADAYEVLDTCDALITDYSSVFYDFANTGRRIVLYVPDLEEYVSRRGLYRDPVSLPFALTRTAAEAAGSLHAPMQAMDPDFFRQVCTWEDGYGAEKILRCFLKGENCLEAVTPDPGNVKNVLLYGGDFARNGITTAFVNLLEAADFSGIRFFVSFRMDSLKNDPRRLDVLPPETDIFPIASEMNMDPVTGIAQALYLRKGMKGAGIEKRLCRAFRDEWKKHFGRTDFAHIVHFNGYENYIIQLFRWAEFPRTIWAHNDMVKETAGKGYPNRYVLRDAYSHYETAVGVSQDAAASILALGGRAERTLVVPNLINGKEILRRGRMEMTFDPETKSTVSLERLRGILCEEPGIKLINIGRFSPEKGHIRLTEAFESFQADHPEAWLIIVGGAGTDYEKTCARALVSPAASRIILIYSLSNPMPVLARCDCLVLSSHYEGYGLVLLEAACLEVPCFACDVPGARELMKEYGGTLVPDSREGILEGMEACLEGKIPVLNVRDKQKEEITLTLFHRILEGGYD